MLTPGRWSLKGIVIGAGLILAVVALLAIGTLVAGHLQISSGTATIEQVTVPGLLESSRVARNLEHLRRYGDMAVLADSPTERAHAQMSMTLIATHPSMQAGEIVKARVRKAERTLSEALALSATNHSAQSQAMALWTPAAEDLTALADELTTESSLRATDDAHRIHSISTKTLEWLTVAIVILLLCVLLFGGFLMIFIARPLQRNAQVLDHLDDRARDLIDLPDSPVREIERLRIATHALSAAMANAEQSRLELERLATVDGLSKLFNRRHFSHLAEAEWLRSRRYLRPLAVLMADIDLFKLINDQHGHAAGDQVIISFANLMKRVVRASDQIARVGGEEFAVLMPEADLAAAMNVAERLCAEAADNTVVFQREKEISYTVSVGVAILDPADQRFDELMQRADTGLYRAKRSGRNRVEFAQIEVFTAAQS